jgi:hypothetical protein
LGASAVKPISLTFLPLAWLLGPYLHQTAMTQRGKQSERSTNVKIKIDLTFRPTFSFFVERGRLFCYKTQMEL